MKKLMTMATLSAILLSGCGTQSAPSMPAIQAQSAMTAQGTQALLDGFKGMHMAAFDKLDANHDNNVDEYEAGPNIDLKDFGRADKSKNNKLSKKEFMDYALGGSLFGFMHEDKNKFMKQSREELLYAFKKLDANRDLLIKPTELSKAALKKHSLFLAIDGLRIRVTITERMDDVFAACDKTGDGSLSQAEFEDFCLESFKKLINPNHTPGGDPPAPAPTPAPQGVMSNDSWSDDSYYYGS